MSAFNFAPFPTLFTQRLILRPFRKTDLQGIFEMRSSPQNNFYLDRPAANSIQDAQDFMDKINNGVSKNKWINWGIEIEKTGDFVGSICLWNLVPEKMKGELGYEIHPNFQGNGYTQESIKRVIDYGFDKMNLQTIEAATHEKNAASLHILEKNNFSKIGNLDGDSAHLVLYLMEQKNHK